MQHNILLILLTIILLYSNPSNSQSFVGGVWEVEKHLVIYQGNSDTLYDKNNINPAFNLSNITMEFLSNGDFTGTNIQGEPISGNWTIDGDTLNVGGIISLYEPISSNSFSTIQNIKIPDLNGNIVTKEVKVVFTKIQPLPIELINFKASVVENSIYLNWTTGNEINNQYFEVQHSRNGKNFIVLGKVNANSTGSYEFFHAKPENSKNYYRLKQFDNDGEFSFSKTISINFEANNKQVIIHPNPAKNIINFDSEKPLLQVSIIDANGKKIKPFKDYLNNQIDISYLNNGLYLLLFQFENGSFYTEKFIKS